MFCRRNGARWMLPRSILAMRRNMKRRLSKSRRICEGIGGELAHDLDALAVHLPQMLLSPSSRVFIVAGGGRGTGDPQRGWGVFCKKMIAPAHNEKKFTFSRAFLTGGEGEDPKVVL